MGKHYKTGTVSKRLGIAPALLRMWETRYGIVTPARGPGGQRLYSEADVDYLSALRALVADGHAIGEIASWPRDDILASASRSQERTTPTRPSAILTTGERKQTVILAIDAEGLIVVASPNTDILFGWPHALLVGQPIWGLMVDVPPALVRHLDGRGPPRSEISGWAWMRTRTGTVIPCRLECGPRRRTSEGSAVSTTVSPLFPDAPDLLAPLLAKVDGAGLVRFEGTTEQILTEHVTAMVEIHGAAFSRVWTYDARDCSLHLIASAGISKAVSTSPRSVIRLANYPFKVGVVARSGIPYVHNGLEADRDFERAWIKREHLESAAVLPLVCDGELFGVMAHFFRRRLEPEDIGKIQANAALCETWIARTRRRAPGSPEVSRPR